MLFSWNRNWTLDLGVSHNFNDIRLISPEVRGLLLLWKELGTKTSKSRSNEVTRVLLEAAWTLYMPSANVGMQSDL